MPDIAACNGRPDKLPSVSVEDEFASEGGTVESIESFPATSAIEVDICGCEGLVNGLFDLAPFGPC